MSKRLASLLALLGIHQHLSAEQKHDLATAAYYSAPGAAVASSAGAVGLPLSRDQERQEDRRRGRPLETDLGSLGG